MIKQEEMTITLTSNTKDYYLSLGYPFEEVKCRDSVAVKSTDLPHSSGANITRICDDCGQEHQMKRVKYRPVCRSCNSHKLNKARKDPSKTTCPECGSQKSYAAEGCRACVDVSGENNPMFGKPVNEALRARNKAISENPELHHNWKGGISKGRNAKQIAWANKVKVSGVCNCCGYTRKVALEAHHYHFSEGKRLDDFDPANGVALCCNCHKEFHKTYGYGGNTKAQYTEFKEIYHANA